jgi:tetratricopeptide (TPR) repeat protein
MYLDPSLGPRRRRQSSPRRIIILLLLILAGLVFLSRHEQIAKPFVPTPTPTPGAFIFAQQAVAAYEAGNLQGAIDYYRRAVRLAPDDSASRIPLSRLLILTGDPEAALDEAEKAVELSSDSARALAALCQAQDWNGQVEEAIETCRRAIDLDPTYAEAHAYLAEAYADSILNGDYNVSWQRAIQEAERAVELDRRSVDAYRNLGYVWNSQGYYQLSNDYYQKALEIHPNLGFLYVQMAINHRALIAYHANRAEWALAEASYEAAVAILDKAIQVDQQNSEAYEELGWLYFGNEQLNLAQENLEKAVEIDPEFARAWSRLGFTRFRRRNYEGAEEALRKAAELGYDRIETYYTLGLVLYYLARCEEAMPYFNQALAIDPEDANALEGIRLCLEAEQGNTGQSP